MTETVDLLVVGAGVFGAHAALHFARQGRRVLLVDREAQPWNKASLVNQARVHSGHHYPRSLATARMANENRARFLADQAPAINAGYTAYYGIDRQGSLTHPGQFERFCAKLDLPLKRVDRADLFDGGRLEALYETQEVSFDPLLLRRRYQAELAAEAVETAYGWRPVRARVDGRRWRMTLAGPDGAERCVDTPAVVNATYANLNAVNALFGVAPVPATHELSEIVLLHAPTLAGVGLTVMDGPYVSLMPFGRTGLLSLTSVLYTHRAYSAADKPAFACQAKRPSCTPDALRACTACPARPSSNARKMVAQLRHYLTPGHDLYVHGSLRTVKTKLKRSVIDDGRPTEIEVCRREPFLAHVFSGKINSVYEIERVTLDD